ncbi:unnamed protein product, partial [Anisakis simplex]|uniref:MAST4 n=1 Tax=Anisakis simplex TaxID=6269 RepID=A0A0M3JI32_ANISI
MCVCLCVRYVDVNNNSRLQKPSFKTAEEKNLKRYSVANGRITHRSDSTKIKSASPSTNHITSVTTKHVPKMESLESFPSILSSSRPSQLTSSETSSYSSGSRRRKSTPRRLDVSSTVDLPASDLRANVSPKPDATKFTPMKMEQCSDDHTEEELFSETLPCGQQ